MRRPYGYVALGLIISAILRVHVDIWQSIALAAMSIGAVIADELMRIRQAIAQEGKGP